ncbi:MAG: transcriptional repressor [Pseudomonadota bacterium]
MRTRGEVMQSKILAVLKHADSALSAYDILEALRDEFPKIAPPTVYRGLAALTEKGSVHRVESLNSFVACTNHNHDHASIMSICDDCGSVEENEAPKIFDDLSGLLGKTGFDAHRHVIEVHGVCAACGDQDNAS